MRIRRTGFRVDDARAAVMHPLARAVFWNGPGGTSGELVVLEPSALSNHLRGTPKDCASRAIPAHSPNCPVIVRHGLRAQSSLDDKHFSTHLCPGLR